MGTLVRLLGFVLAFTLEVRVHASEAIQIPEVDKVQEEPAGCLVKFESCAVRTPLGRKYHLQVGSGTIVLDQLSTVIRVSLNEVRLVAGTIWVQAKNPIEVRTEFGAARIEQGEFWVSRTDERMVVSATDRVVTLHPRGSDETLEVLPGWENWLGKVLRSGRADSGVPVPMRFEAHLERWARLYSGSKKSFTTEVHRFYSRWKTASEQSVEVHRSLYERKVAAVDAKVARERERKRREEERNRELREIFKRRVFGLE